MSVPARLLECAGLWSGTNRLHDPYSNSPSDSASELTVTPMLAGRFLRFDYTWTYDGKPQEGTILLGGDHGGESVSAYWADTWHMSHAAMTCTGQAEENSRVNFRGTYPAPPGPDWGWRIDLRVETPVEVRMLMFNITPDGDESPAVEASWRRRW